jgi:hypothetical protein
MAKKIARCEKRNRTQLELQEASKHLFWEMRYLSERLQFVLRFSQSPRRGEMEGIVAAIHESFLLHARKVAEFLFEMSDRVYEDDVIAQDFFSDPDRWRQVQPSPTPTIRQMQQNVGRLLAHFTYSVIDHTEGRLTWNTSDIYVGLFEALQLFLRQVDPSLLHINVDLLRADNPRIVICRPIYPPEGRPPYQIACVRDLASGFDADADK